MNFGFRRNCRFCHQQKLEPAEPLSFDWLRKIFCIGTFFCPHCFDVFRRPVIPGIAATLFWLGGYVSMYVISTNPIDIVAYEWPDEKAPVVSKFVFAPLIKFDPRVHEARLNQERFGVGVSSQVAAEPGDTAIR